MRSRIREMRPFGIIILVLGALFWAVNGRMNAADEVLRVSGTLEAAQVGLVSEVAGQVIVVSVTEGDTVQAGDVLVEFEDEVLRTEFERAAAELEAAKLDYQLIQAQPLEEARQVRISAAQLELLLARQALEDLLENARIAQAEAAQSVEDAEQALEDLLASDLPARQAWSAVAAAQEAASNARRDWTALTTPPSQAALDQAYANLLLAEQERDETLADIADAQAKIQGGANPYWPFVATDDYRKGLRKLIQNLEIKLARTEIAYQQKVERYDDLLSPPDPLDLALAEAELAKTEAHLEAAQRQYARVEDGPSPAQIARAEARLAAARREAQTRDSGPDPAELAIAQARVACAEANLSLAQSDTIQEELAVAGARLETARTALGVIQARLDKLTLTAPFAGVVLEAAVEPGEIVEPGDQIASLGLFDDLELTVYAPAPAYKQVAVGDEFDLSLGSLPGQTVSARITGIAAPSEFVHRHVESDNGSPEMIFPITLAVENSARLLRPGMVAEVAIED